MGGTFEHRPFVNKQHNTYVVHARTCLSIFCDFSPFGSVISFWQRYFFQPSKVQLSRSIFSPLVAVPKSFTAVTFTVVKNCIRTEPAPDDHHDDAPEDDAPGDDYHDDDDDAPDDDHDHDHDELKEEKTVIIFHRW